MDKILYILIYFVFICEVARSEDRQLPLGQRQYILNSKVPFAPVLIAPLGVDGKSSGTMRDPIPLGAKPQLGNSKGPGPRAAPQKRVSRMVFEQVGVKGRYLVPRVSFDRPPIEVERSEESLRIDFRAKIKASEEILRDFDW